MNVTQHLSWVYVLEEAAKRFCLDPATLEDMRRKGIPEMLKWAEETGVKIVVPDDVTDATTRVGEAILATNPRTGNPIWESCSFASLAEFRSDAVRLTKDLTEITTADLGAADWQSLYDSYKDA